MKLILIALGLFLSFATSAQRNTGISKNGREDVLTFKTTTDSTLTYIDSITVGNNEAGLVTASIVGYAYDTAYAVTAELKARYNKRRGTLTLGSVIEDQTPVTDAALGTATATIVAASNKIYVRVKGKAATNIRWTCILKQKAIRYQ